MTMRWRITYMPNLGLCYAYYHTDQVYAETSKQAKRIARKLWRLGNVDYSRMQAKPMSA
jgi:hypothetical protein